MGFEVSDQTLAMLEWEPLEAALSAEAATPGGKRLIAARRWADDDEIEPWLDEVSEARALLAFGVAPPFEGIQELDPHLAQARKGGILGGMELLAVAEVLRAARLARHAISKQRVDAPHLAEIADAIPSLSELDRAIHLALDRQGCLLDAASRALASAREEVRALSGKIQKRIAGAMTSPLYAPHLQDRFYTLRGERYVLPIKIESRSHVRGIIHDISASGTTVFVEPEEIVDLNNRLRLAELTVERESIRILRELTARVAAVLDAIVSTIETVSRLDLIFSRARLSERLGASRPRIVPEPRLTLRAARHPLLTLRGHRLVPNDLVVGESYQALILSGPNAGGKTVCLKTAGLAVLMVRAGLHVPAEKGTVVGRFARVFADIGDDQSLAQSLSTFSGQIAQMVNFLHAADPLTLVLLDEIVVGTDPAEGAVLAQSLLEALVGRGARVVVTTHYQPLKELAARDQRFQNASMELDPESLRLTYRMIPGVPGHSSAIEIASGLGLNPEVIARSRELLGGDRRELETSLRQLNDLRVALETEKREAARVKAENEDARREWVEKLRQIERERERISKDLKASLDAEIKRAHGEIAGVIRELQRRGTAQEAATARKRIARVEARAREVLPAAPAAPRPALDWSRIKPGARLHLARLGATAELVEGPNASGQIRVVLDGKRMRVPAADIEGIEPPGSASPPPAARPAAPPAVRNDSPRGSVNTLDVRGLRAEDAETKLVYFLDRLYGAGEATAYVVHGHGTGALKAALRAYLSTCPYATGFRPADPHQGGDGVTVITIRD